MKKVISIILTLLLLSSFYIDSMAAVPYAGYSYDDWSVAIPTAVGYLPSEVFYGDADNKISFNAPEDLYVTKDGRIFVLDTGSASVIILDKNFELIKKLEVFKLQDGSDYKLFTPKGIFVRDDLIYIADYDNMKVVISDFNGNIKMQIAKPENKIFPQESEFRPMRVLVDSEGSIYVLVLGVYQGAAVFKANGEFVGYYGSNSVLPTVKVLMDRFWKRLLNREQKSSISNYVPVQFTSFDILDNDFVYSCTAANTEGMSELRYINPMGKNIWAEKNNQGDLEVGWYKNKGYYSAFVDVAATNNEFLYALDSTKGRIFLYDPDGNLVMIFGGKGAQRGTFALPSAIDTYEEKVYVLDSGKSSLTVFEPTEYGKLVKKALTYLSNGDYDQSREIWEKVLKQDGNLFVAYYGIGKALYYSGEYKQAMEYFNMAKVRSSESRAFKEYRTAIIRTYFPYIMSGIALMVMILVIMRVVKRKVRRKGDAKHA